MDLLKSLKTENSVLKSVLNELKRSVEELEAKNSVYQKGNFLLEERNKILEGKLEKLLQTKKNLETQMINVISKLNFEMKSLVELYSKQIEEILSQKEELIDSHASLCNLKKVVSVGEKRLEECCQVLDNVRQTEQLMEDKLVQFKDVASNGTEMLDKNWTETCHQIEELVDACDQLLQVTNYKHK
ncbi:hypothetical protein Avbf_01875 [Armadillidium vulgare]|nr:hypothetical protein Avbf_01875 [Armadillidium vulgare]